VGENDVSAITEEFHDVQVQDRYHLCDDAMLLSDALFKCSRLVLPCSRRKCDLIYRLKVCVAVLFPVLVDLNGSSLDVR
jgi:hypothetical protein